MNKTVLVTGGAGAIGSAICRRLITRGASVVVLDDLSSGSMKNLPPDVSFLRGTVEREAALSAAFSNKPDYVIHAAALFANQNSVDHPDKDLNVNGSGTLKVLDYCQKYQVQKCVYLSSSCVYGQKDYMEESDTDLNPETPYAITKLLGEQYCKFWATFHGLNVAIVRIFNTYGPGERPGIYRNVIPNFLSLALEGEPLPITGTGSETRSYVYVQDTVSGILNALEKNTEPAAIFNIASQQEVPIAELANRINVMTANQAGVIYKPRRAWDSVTRRRASTSKSKRLLDFETQTSLDEGLRHTLQWFKENVEQGASHRLRVPSSVGPRGLPGGQDSR